MNHGYTTLRYAQRPDAQPKVLNGKKLVALLRIRTVRERRERSGKIERGEQDEDHKAATHWQ